MFPNPDGYTFMALCVVYVNKTIKAFNMCNSDGGTVKRQFLGKTSIRHISSGCSFSSTARSSERLFMIKSTSEQKHFKTLHLE